MRNRFTHAILKFRMYAMNSAKISFRGTVMKAYLKVMIRALVILVVVNAVM